MNRLPRLRARSRGQALTEFALVIPIFLVFLIAIVDTGRLVYSYNTLSQAAREGSRVAAVQAGWIGVPAADCDLPSPGCPADTPTFRQRTVAGVNRMAVALGSIASSSVTLTCTGPNGSSSSDCAALDDRGHGSSTVSVGVAYTFRPIVGQIFQPIFGLFRIAPTVNLSASSSMAVN